MSTAYSSPQIKFPSQHSILFLSSCQDGSFRFAGAFGFFHNGILFAILPLYFLFLPFFVIFLTRYPSLTYTRFDTMMKSMVWLIMLSLHCTSELFPRRCGTHYTSTCIHNKLIFFGLFRRMWMN